MHSIVQDLLILTFSAILIVPFFKKAKLGAILAYLFIGVLIGPRVLGLIVDGEVIHKVSEFGVVFLLFIIGLELAPKKLWEMRVSIFGLGSLQLIITGFIFTFISTVLGLSVSQALVIGFALALSSTAFGLQILEENRQLKTSHGQGSFSILLFQDIAVVPLLAFVSILSGKENGDNFTLIGISKLIAIVLIVIGLGRYLTRWVLRLVADLELHEIFIATTLAIVLGTGLLMEKVGMSMGMGALLAGILLADSEYRHELESNLQPFKGLLLGLFFITVGMSLNINVLKDKYIEVTGLTFGLMIIKGIVIFILGILFKYPKESSRNMAFTLSQGGEFAFVIFSAALLQNILSSELTSIVAASVTLSMALTPVAFFVNQNLLRKYSELVEKPFDRTTSEDSEIIIAGFGRFGQIVSRFLDAQNIHFTVLEHSAAQVETARKFGTKIFYGDASRKDILEAAGIKQAKLFILAIDDPIKSVEAATVVTKNFPNVQVIARARNRQHVISLMEVGVKIIHRETLLTSLEVAKEIMLFRGEDRNKINQQLAKFRIHDEEVLKHQFEVRDDENKLISLVSQSSRELERILKEDHE